MSYEGNLVSAGDSRQKQSLRELWHQEPLKKHRWRYTEEVPRATNLERLEDHRFVPLATSRLALLVELDILLVKAPRAGKADQRWRCG